MSKNKNAAMVLGASGRMGQSLSQILPSHGFIAEWGISGTRPASGYAQTANRINKESLKEVSVVIDFSTPETLLGALPEISEAKKPLVTGTTGLTAAQMKTLRGFAKKIPILWAPNMSIGIAALRRSLLGFATLEDFKFKIEETHHENKKDSPSGTALIILRDLEKLLGHEISPIISIRTGSVIGEHRVIAQSSEEVLEIKHTALNRSVFASGAATSARWILKRKPGFYSLDDVLNDK